MEEEGKILPIYLYNHPVLRTECEDVEDVNAQEVTELVQNMKKTIEDIGGLGLSAPQVGEDKAIFVVNLPGLKEVFINPDITDESEEIYKEEEGCLSLPELFIPIERSERIEIEYYDENGQFKTINYKGLEGRVIQHELDHLEGVLTVDHLSSSYRRMLKPKIDRIVNNKVDPSYRVRTNKNK